MVSFMRRIGKQSMLKVSARTTMVHGYRKQICLLLNPMQLRLVQCTGWVSIYTYLHIIVIYAKWGWFGSSPCLVLKISISHILYYFSKLVWLIHSTWSLICNIVSHIYNIAQNVHISYTIPTYCFCSDSGYEHTLPSWFLSIFLRVF